MQSRKRLGRGTGSGLGAKSTRGTKRHQHAKEKIPLFFEGGQNKLTKKLPLLRGKGKNKSYFKKPLIIHHDVLNIFSNNMEVTVDALILKKIVDDEASRFGVKIIKGNGKLDRALTVKMQASNSVRVIIEKAGGKVLL